MRSSDLHADRWCLEDGEQRHLEAPATFDIPDIKVRQALQPGDMAKLIFSIVVQGNDVPSVGGMWVIP